MIHRMRLLLLLTLVCLMPVCAHAADVRASVDRTQVQLGETVTLNLQLRGATGMNSPDLSALRNDFDVLGTSTSSSINIVNGRQSVQVTYGVALRPRHVGHLQIPALQVAGSTTKPLSVNVTQPAPTSQSNSGKAVFLESSVDPHQAYVGQQVVLTVRIYFAVNLTRGSLDDPAVEDADVARLGDDRNYQAQRFGRTYNVIARRYSLTPQHAGTLKIGSAQFQGAMMFQGDPFAPSDPGNFFGNGRDISAASPALQLQIKPVPKDWGSAAWLPARALSLSLDDVPGPTDTVRVGQPFTVTMNLQATGLSFDALPTLSLPDVVGATAYPDQPVTSDHDDGPWVVGRRQHSFAIVPSKPGTMLIPETTLKWWNVLTDQSEVATIPAHTLHVLPAAGAAGSAPASGTSATPASAIAPAASSPGAAPDVRKSVPARGKPLRIESWYGVVLGAVVLLGLALVAWLRRRRRAPAVRAAGTPKGNTKRLREAFFAAARGRDAAAQGRALLDWARSERPSLPHLGALAAALAPATQREAISQLQRRIYAANDAVDRGHDRELERAFESGLVWADTPGDSDNDDLPPLYPFKLHD